MPRQATQTTFNVMRAAEGGIGQREALRRLKAAGIKAGRGYSPYVGHVGVTVYGGKRIQARADRVLYG